MLKWFQNLTGGINNAVDSPLASNNQSPHLKNITLRKLGNWMTRKGTALYQNRIGTSTGIYGLFDYESFSTSTGVVTHRMGCVYNRSLYMADNGETSWGTAVAATAFPASTFVRAIDHMNRAYLATDDGSTALKYWDGTTLTTTSPAIPGGIVAANKHILALAGANKVKNMIFYTTPYTDKFYTATFTVSSSSTSTTLVAPSGTFTADMVGAEVFNATDGAFATIIEWGSSTTVTLNTSIGDTWDGDTAYVIQNVYRLGGTVNSMVGFKENFVSWDEDTMYVWDPVSIYESKFPDFGCAGQDTVQSIDGKLFWLDHGGIYMWDGSSSNPQEISSILKDKENGFGVWDLLNTANFDTACSGKDEVQGRYYLSVGDLQTVTGAPASGVTNAVLVYDISMGEWELYSYNRKPQRFSGHLNSAGTRNLYFGDSAHGSVFKTDTGTTDAVGDGTTAAISYEAQTKQHILGSQVVTRIPNSIFARYVADSTVTAAISPDGGTMVTQTTMPASASSVAVAEIRPTRAVAAVSHSIKFSGTGKFVLKGYGFDMMDEGTTRTRNI